MPFRIRETCSDNGDELWWRCSRCPALSWWRDGFCDDCRAPLAEEPVIRLGMENFADYFIAAAVVGVSLPLQLDCPQCAEMEIAVAGIAVERGGVEGYQLQADCTACGLSLPTEPEWIPVQA